MMSGRVAGPGWRQWHCASLTAARAPASGGGRSPLRYRTSLRCAWDRVVPQRQRPRRLRAHVFDTEDADDSCEEIHVGYSGA